MDRALSHRRLELERRIARDRSELQRALGELRTATRERLGLGHHIAARPAPWLVGGFMFGLWLGWRR